VFVVKKHLLATTGLISLLTVSPSSAQVHYFSCIPAADGRSWICKNSQAAHPLTAGGFSPTSTAAPGSSKRLAALCKRPARPAGPGLKSMKPGQADIQADRSSGNRQRMTLGGNVLIRQNKQNLQADTVIYDKRANLITAKGHVRFTDKSISIEGSSARKQITGDRALIRNARYEITTTRARGAAREIRKLNASLVRLDKASYTSCPVGNRDWILKAREVRLDREKGVGKAKNVVLRFKGVPIFYAPRLSFPIDDRRKSGFLMPSIGSSSKRGFDISTPWYWNIAPNRDATIKPRYMEKRGFQLGLQYRYLSRRGRGDLGLEYLPDDDVSGKDRSLITYRQKGKYGDFNTDVNYSRVSDQTYFTDLGSGLSVTSATHLEQRADVKWSKHNWNVLMRLQRFQPLINSSENYQQLPMIDVNGGIPTGRRWLQLNLHAQYVDFEHKDNVVTGRRIDIQPAVGIEIRRPGWFVNPRLSVRHTRYDLENPGAGNPSTPDRTTPIFSLDGGVYLERDTRLFSSRYIQTLEPRVYYLYVPYRDQSGLPVFDSSSNSFSFQQLFRDNRFSGADRQGDANQITLALTTRYLERRTGREWLRASIGQIYYFEDRRVTLPGQTAVTDKQSDIVAEFYLALSRHLHLTAASQWDTNTSETQKSSLLLRYHVPGGSLFNAGYRFERGLLEQADVSLLWRLSTRWSAIARWNYSLRNEQTLERLAGIEYNSCCWGVRLVAQQYINSDTGQEDNAIYLQLVLKGLGKLGEDIDSLLKRRILGYTDRR
jgi:LPS-assembly protein